MKSIEIGDKVKITNGAWSGYIGILKSILIESCLVRLDNGLQISFFKDELIKVSKEEHEKH